MRIIDDMVYADNMEEVLTVIAVRPLEDYRLWLRFSDGKTKICDFAARTDRRRNLGAFE